MKLSNRVIVSLFFVSTSIHSAARSKLPPTEADKVRAPYIDHGMEVAAKVHKIPLKLLRAVCYVESKHNPHATRLVDGGTPSYGLCQLKLATAQKNGYMGGIKGLLDAHNNALYAAKELARWYYKGNKDWRIAVTSYNKGHYSTKKFNTYSNLVALVMKDSNKKSVDKRKKVS